MTINTSPAALAELKARPATIHRLFDGDFVVALIDALEETRAALKGAYHALESYAHGNASKELAESMAAHCKAVLDGKAAP